MALRGIEETTLTAIANALRSKRGTSEPIDVADFASEISSIEGNGSSGECVGTHVIEVDTLPNVEVVDYNTVYLCDGKYYIYSAPQFTDVIVFFGAEWGGYIEVFTQMGLPSEMVSANTIPTKTTEGILESDLENTMHFYYIVDENNVFIFMGGQWVSMEEAVGGELFYGGTIYDISEATDTSKFYALMSGGWKDYRHVSEIVDIIENGDGIDVADAKIVNVNIPIPDGYVKPSGEKVIKTNGTHDVKYYSTVKTDVPIPDGYVPEGTVPDGYVLPNGTKIITENGENIDVANFEKVNVNVASANIAYGDTEPTDTSKLWVKTAEPNNVIVSPTLKRVLKHTQSDTLPFAFSGDMMVTVGTKVYLFGVDAGAGSKKNIVCFDTETQTSTTLSTVLSVARILSGTAVVGTKIYLFGGMTSSSNFVDDILCFDTETETISTLSTVLPNRIRDVATVAVGTKIYLFGGLAYHLTLNSQKTKSIYCFDTETQTLTKLSATLPEISFNIGACAIGTKIYLFGGCSDGYTIDTISCFDTETQTITKLSTKLSDDRDGIGVATVGTKIYLFGGSYSNAIECFDTETQTLTTLAETLPRSTEEIGVAVVDNKIYLFGGLHSSDLTKRLNSINLYVAEYELAYGAVQIVPSLHNNIFKIINRPDVTMEIGVSNVYVGNTEAQAVKAEAYLHNGVEWTLTTE